MVDYKTIDREFDEKLGSFTLSDANRIYFNLGNPSRKLRMAGIEDKPIKLNGSKLVKKIRKHEYEIKELKGLSKAIRNPIAVFQNENRKGAYSVLTTLKTKDGNFLVAVDLGKGSDDNNNMVSTIFGKKKESVIRWIKKGKLKYVDKEKALRYLHSDAPIATATDTQELISAANIIRNFQNHNNTGYVFSSG